MKTYSLFFLDDQNGDVRGAKTLDTIFGNLEDAQQAGLTSEKAHFSIEQNDENTGEHTLIYIC